MSERDRDSGSGSMKRSAGNAFGNVMGCFFGLLVIFIIIVVIGSVGGRAQKEIHMLRKLLLAILSALPLILALALLLPAAFAQQSRLATPVMISTSDVLAWQPISDAHKIRLRYKTGARG